MTFSILPNAWVAYLATAYGFLFLCLVGANVWKAWELRKERQAVERLERFMYRRFGDGGL